MFDIIPKHDGYRLNHEHFECVTDTTYVVGAVKELKEDDKVIVHVDAWGDMCLPSFYHCGKYAELTRANSLRGGASAFYECKQEGKDVDAIVVCRKNEPVGVIGFADHKPHTCCFEPWAGTQITNTNPWIIEDLPGTGSTSIKMVPEGLLISAVGGDYNPSGAGSSSDAWVILTLPQSFVKWTKLGEWQEIEGIHRRGGAPKTGHFLIDWDVTVNVTGDGGRPGVAGASVAFGGQRFVAAWYQGFTNDGPVDSTLPIYTSGNFYLPYYDHAVVEVGAGGATNNPQGTAPKSRGRIEFLLKYMCIEPTYATE